MFDSDIYSFLWLIRKVHLESSFGTNERMRKSLIFVLNGRMRISLIFVLNERKQSFFQNEFKKIFDSLFRMNKRLHIWDKWVLFE
jgi:hypothetical protein